MPQWWPLWGESSNFWLSKFLARCCGKNNKRAMFNAKKVVASAGEPSLKGDSYQSKRALGIAFNSKGSSVRLSVHQFQTPYRFARPLIRWREASEQGGSSQPVPNLKKSLVTKVVFSSNPNNVNCHSSKRHESVVEEIPSLAAQFPFLHPSELREAFPSH